jgi:16S rRNA (cytidine1402-2'-O)-methyltransferase
MVIVVAPPDREEEMTAADLDALLRQALNRLSVKDAVAEIAAVSGAPRREVYRRAIALSKERSDAR